MSELHDYIPSIVREDAIDQQKKRPALDYVNHQKEPTYAHQQKQMMHILPRK